MRLFLWIVLIVVAYGVGVGLGFRPEHSGHLAFWAWVAVPSLALAAVAVWRAQRDGELRDWLTPRWGDFTVGFVSAAIFFGIVLLGAKILAPHGSPREVWVVSLYSQFGDPKVLQSQAALVGMAILVLAASEEIVWRGLVTTLLAERVGSRTAWIWSAVLYAVAHLSSAWALRGPAGLNPLLVIAALVGGLFWGGLARRSGRLTPAILSHALFDWCALMMFPLWDPRMG
jgi:membrane protease YdiL (CAAX protease family)